MSVGPEPLGLPLPPSTAIRYLKVLWHVTETALTSDFLQYNYGMQMRAIPTLPGDPPADEWRRFQLVFDNTQSLVNADQAIFTVDVVNYTNGVIDSSWTQADYDAVQNNLGIFINAIKPHIVTRYTWTFTRVYRMIFTAQPIYPLPPNYVDKPFEDSGPPVIVYQPGIAGTGGPGSIDQFACSVTEEVPLRKHWGRFYLPPMAQTDITTAGRISTTTVDAVAGAWNTCLSSLGSGGFYAVVPHTQNQKKYIRAMSNVTGIHVDDIPDVIRRRRLKYVGYKKSYNVGAPSTGISQGFGSDAVAVDVPL